VHRIYARSYDGISYSEEYLINVTVDNDVVNNPPVVTISNPDDNDIVSGPVSVSGTASDYDGNLQKVEVSIDNTGWITAAGTSSWTYSWDTTKEQDGEHVILARAVDEENEFSATKSVSVTVDNSKNSPPTLNITSPTEDTVSGEVEIRGTASDPDGDGTLSIVEVKVNGNWQQAYGTVDWTYEWDTRDLDDGYYIISARAFDGAEYSTIDSISVYVDNPHQPTLVITSGVPEKASGIILIFGTASDVDGAVVKVEIQIDSGEWKVLQGTSDWSYTLDTRKLDNGEHTLKILATDDEGEFHMETLTFEVENPEEFSLWIIIWIIVIVILLVIIAGIIAWKKGS
jgi:hypothetical protein